MAKRTPIGTSTSFDTNPFNPSETEFQAYWGQYPYDSSSTPNTVEGRSGSVGSASLPNEQGNLLGAREFQKLRPGDTASTAFDQNIASGAVPASTPQADATGLFMCVYPGTEGNGDAVWVRLDQTGGGASTVRAAPVITVAQSGVTIPGAPPPYDLGGGAGVEADYIDTGDGARLNAALLAAAAANVPIDIRLRPCGIRLNQAGSPASPLTLANGCRLQGAGRGISSIQSDDRSGNTQETLVMGKGSELLDIQIKSDAQETPGAGASKAVVRIAGSTVRVKDCAFSVLGNTRTQPWMVWDASGTAQILDSTFAGSDSDNDNAAGPCIGVVLGPDQVVTPDTYIPLGTFEVSRCQFYNSNRAILIYNVGAGHISEVDAENMQRSAFGVIAVVFGGTVVQPQPTIACTIEDVRMYISQNEAIGDTTYTGVTLQNLMDGLNVGAFAWTAIRVAFFAPDTPTVVRNAFRVLANGIASGGVHIEGGSLVGCYALGHTRGLFIDAFGIAAQPDCKVTSLRVSACVFKGMSDAGATPGVGILLQTNTTAAAVENIGLVNCDCNNAQAGQYGIRIADATCKNTIVVANNLTASGGTAFLDAGTGTEAGHNIL